MAVTTDLKQLLESGAHFGHQARRWNPKMSEYVYGVSEGVHVFDLIKTKVAFDEALEFLSKAAGEGKKIIFLGTKKQAKEKTQEVALQAECFYVIERWLGGTLTNFKQIQVTLKNLQQLKEDKASGKFNEYTKKERVLLDRKIAKMERFFGGLAGIESIPDILIVIDTKKENSAIREAKATGVTTVGLTDSNADPTVIDYPIPMNDDAKKSVEYVISLVKEALGGTSTPKKQIVKREKK